MLFFLSNPSVTRATTASAIFRFFIFVLIAIVGSIVIWHWWNASVHNGNLAFTQVAAKTTHTLFAREEFVPSACPPEDDCSVTTAVQTYAGVLYAYYDISPFSVVIGSSAYRCVTVGGLNTPDAGIFQQCAIVYTFNGEGNYTAGTIAARNIVLSQPDGEFDMTLSPIVGGTGPYKLASGGVVSMVHNPEVLTLRDLSFADVVMS